MSDEGFHEIQLNGKQLVFLFMAATVVSVVIFLCGVMVGRGVRAQQGMALAGELGSGAAVEEPSRPEPASPAPARDSAPPSTPPPAPAGAQPGAPPPDPPDDSSYYDQLTKSEGEKEPKVAPAPVPEPRAAAPAPAAKAEKPAPPPVTASPPAAVTGSGFVVQIAALRDRSEADAIVKRLAGKGYQAFVVNPVPGKPPVYKVQVGRFAERGDAEKIALRLKSEEQYSPWVTR